MLQFSSESGGYCRIPVTEWDICCWSTGQREGGGCPFFDPTGGAWWPEWRRWWRERYGWLLDQFLLFSSFLSPHGIVFFIFIRYNRPFAGKTNPPFFVFLFFWRGLMESRFHYKNVLVMFLLFNQTYVLGNVRPELFFVYNCRSFLSVLLLFFTTDIHAFIYFTLFLRGFFIQVFWYL